MSHAPLSKVLAAAAGARVFDDPGLLTRLIFSGEP